MIEQLKPCHSLEPNHRITAVRTGGPPPARPPPPAPHLLQLYQQQQQQQQHRHHQQLQSQPQQQFKNPTYYNHPYGSHPQVEGKPPPPPPYISRPTAVATPPLNIPQSVHENIKNSNMTSTSTTTPTTTTTTSSASDNSNNHHFIHQQRTLLTSTPNNSQYIHTTDSSYDTPPDMLSPPVPPRRQVAGAATLPPGLSAPTSSSGFGESDNVNTLTQAVAATAAAVTAGITRLERNCWQDYSDTQLLQKDSLRSSSSSSSNQSNTSTSSSSSASFVTAASRFSLYQSSPPQQGCEPPIPAPRLKKDKEVYLQETTKQLNQIKIIH